jgi:hypothetical protein
MADRGADLMATLVKKGSTLICKGVGSVGNR